MPTYLPFTFRVMVNLIPVYVTPKMDAKKSSSKRMPRMFISHQTLWKGRAEPSEFRENVKN